MNIKDEPRRFESETLGLPPLKMVLVHAETDHRDRPTKKTSVVRKSQKNMEHLKAVVRLIDHLMEEE
jgi:2-phosphoglycerate kinase